MVVGIVALIGGGTLLVRGASDIATRFGVSPMIVGLTVVGFGTSAPELIINVVGALLLSLFLTAILIPIFIFGDARLGRNIGAFLLLTYFGYAFLRISS